MAVHTAELRRHAPLSPSVRGHDRRARARRRLTTIALAASVVVGTLLIGGSSPASRQGSPRAIVVRSGQTLWGIADRYAPDELDVRAYIDALVVLNDLDGPLEAGQRLRLPH